MTMHSKANRQQAFKYTSVRGAWKAWMLIVATEVFLRNQWKGWWTTIATTVEPAKGVAAKNGRVSCSCLHYPRTTGPSVVVIGFNPNHFNHVLRCPFSSSSSSSSAGAPNPSTLAKLTYPSICRHIAEAVRALKHDDVGSCERCIRGEFGFEE